MKKYTMGFNPQPKSPEPIDLNIFEQGNRRNSSALLFCLIILMSFILLIPVNKTVKHPSHNVTIDNLSTLPYYQSYIEDISSEPIPQFTELLSRVGEFSSNVDLVPALAGFQNGIIQGDWGIFNFAKVFVNYLTYPFVWGYNIISATWSIFDLFI